MPWVVCDVCKGAGKVTREVRYDTKDENGKPITTTKKVVQDCPECGGDRGWNRNM